MEFDRCFLFSRLQSCRVWKIVLLIESCKSYLNPPLCHTKPHISWPRPGVHDPKASLQRVQAGAPCPSPHCTPSGTESGPATAWPAIQHPPSPSLRPHLNSLYMPCTTPACWPDNTNLNVRVRHSSGTRGTPSNLGSPQSSPPLFIRWTPLW